MPNGSLLRLFADENGVSRADPDFTRELTAVEFAPPAPPSSSPTLRMRRRSC